jgi:predicted Fe-Mo cluster-binding NifX family protein
MMKVAVTSQGPDLDSQVDPRFGRAPYFLLVDTESGELNIRNNAGSLSADHTAGMQAAGILISLGATAVITEKIGPKAFGTLQAAEVSVYTVTAGSVGKAIEKFKAGELQPLANANVEEHWKQTVKGDANATW